MRQQLMAFYLDWVNDFLTVGKMAEWYGITDEECIQLIEMGKKYHEERVKISKICKAAKEATL